MLKWIMHTILPARRVETAKLESDTLRLLVRAIVTTRPDEIACDECFDQLDRFAESTMEGKDAAEAMPLVRDHLERCEDCREEFEALLAALYRFV